MEQQQTFEGETFEKKLAALGAIGVRTHQVRAKSKRFGIDDTFDFMNEESAREFAHALIEAARAAHEETVVQGYYVDDYSGVLYTCEGEDSQWFVTLHALWSKGRGESVEHAHSFVFGARYGANRMANPESKVFIFMGGRDCDGGVWGGVEEHLTLRDAADSVDAKYKWADGPCSWSVITKDEYETFRL